MPTISNIRKPELRRFAEDLLKTKESDPNAKIDEKQLDELLAIVGDTFLWTNSDNLRARFQSGGMSLDEKVALAKKGLSGSEAKDLQTLAGNPAFIAMITPDSAHAMGALVGAQFANAAPADGATAPAAPARVSNMDFTPAQLAAVQTFAEAKKSGKLRQLMGAASDKIDNPALKAEAMALFDALPPMGPTANPEAFVAAGLWSSAPKGLDALENTARYMAGRQVLVKTTLNSDVFAGQEFLKFKPGGREGITHRASIVGEEGDNFLVKVDGSDEPIKFAKQAIYDLNQPQAILSSPAKDRRTGEIIENAYTAGMGTHCDYKDAFTKAKVAEAALEIGEIVEQLDYTKMKTDGRIGGMGAKQMSELQRSAVKKIHDVIDMKYPKHGTPWQTPGRVQGRNLGRQAMNGAGVCFDQAGVMMGMLMPFKEALGLDVQQISGGVYRNVKSSDENPFRGGAHGWLQLTYRPSMELRIIDRTWQQSDHRADQAYSRWGDRYPAKVMRGMKQLKVRDTDVNMDLSTTTVDRQFGSQGLDGRDNHMSNSQ
jgi:hypothetical protein